MILFCRLIFLFDLKILIELFSVIRMILILHVEFSDRKIKYFKSNKPHSNFCSNKKVKLYVMINLTVETN